jgi:hypothetical protein
MISFEVGDTGPHAVNQQVTQVTASLKSIEIARLLCGIR